MGVASPLLVPKLYLGTSLDPREIPFRAGSSGLVTLGSAMELPQQVRSQVQLGNEGMISWNAPGFGFVLREQSETNGVLGRDKIERLAGIDMDQEHSRRCGISRGAAFEGKD